MPCVAHYRRALPALSPFEPVAVAPAPVAVDHWDTNGFGDCRYPGDYFGACGGFAAASAVIAAIKKAGGSDTEKLIAAMEGMEFDTPKGKMIFRKEDHQAFLREFIFTIGGGTYHLQEIVDKDKTFVPPACKFQSA